MKCSACGAPLDDDSLFCAVCGNRIHQVDASAKMAPVVSAITGFAGQTKEPESVEDENSAKKFH